MRESSMLAATLLLFAARLFARDPEPPPVRIDGGVSGHIHPALCLTKKGTLVAVYCKSEYEPYLITRSTDGGKTWSKPALFPPTEKTRVYPGSLTTLADKLSERDLETAGSSCPAYEVLCHAQSQLYTRLFRS